MIVALKNKFTYIIGCPLVILGVGIPFIVWAICYSCGFNSFPYWMLLAVIGFAYILFGLIYTDVLEIKYRNKNNIISEQDVPQEFIDQKNIKKAPFLYAGIIVLVVLGVFALIYLFSGSWPLL